MEVRIPFKSLRYQSAPSQDWGLSVIRLVQSRGHEHSWTPARRNSNSFLAQSGTLSGLNGLRPGLVLDLNPVVTARMDGAPAAEDRWTYDADSPEVGGNLRWGVTPNLTLNGTVNPDFSQVEADAGQFTFDPRSAVCLPEKRPFFLDGIEQSDDDRPSTTSDRGPIFAAKLTGKVSEGDRVPLLAGQGRDVGDRGEPPLLQPAPCPARSGRAVEAGGRVHRQDRSRLFQPRGGPRRPHRLRHLDTVELQAVASRTRALERTATGPLGEATFIATGAGSACATT